MITTGSALTLFLAKAFGGYMLAAGLSGFTMKKRWAKIIDEMRQSAALPYLAGIAVFALGCAILAAHSLWTDPLAIFITLFGWGAVIEGVMFIILPGVLLNYSSSLLRPAAVPFMAGAASLGGLVLLIIGMTGTVG